MDADSVEDAVLRLDTLVIETTFPSGRTKKQRHCELIERYRVISLEQAENEGHCGSGIDMDCRNLA